MAMYGKGGRRLLYDNQQEYYRIQEARSGSLRPFSSTSKPQIAHDANGDSFAVQPPTRIPGKLRPREAAEGVRLRNSLARNRTLAVVFNGVAHDLRVTTSDENARRKCRAGARPDHNVALRARAPALHQ